jgi:hypothetical protein
MSWEYIENKEKNKKSFLKINIFYNYALVTSLFSCNFLFSAKFKILTYHYQLYHIFCVLKELI